MVHCATALAVGLFKAAYCNEVNFCYLCCVKVRINRGEDED